MKYYLALISERHGEYRHESLIRFKAAGLDQAKQKQLYWASHWYPTENDDSAVECINSEYQYDFGSIAVSVGLCREIAKTTFIELKEIVSEM